MTDSLVVVIPTLNRAQCVPTLMESLHGHCDAYYVLEDDATRAPMEAAVTAAGASWMLHNGTWAAKANHASRVMAQWPHPPDWILVGGDDMRFHDGWYEAAMAVANATGAHVIAPNDLFTELNPKSYRCPHPLIRTSYIAERGACFDGPGTIGHEGYRHCFVDDEIGLLATIRGVFAHAPLSVIEHMHPLAGKAPTDAIYEASYAHYAADRDLFLSRATALLP